MGGEVLIKVCASFAVMFISCFPINAQTVVSEKSTIRIEIVDKNLQTIQLSQPEILPGKTSVFEESKIKVFGRLINSRGDEKIMINDRPATLTSDKYFYSDVTLVPGPGDIKIDIISGGKTVNEFSYPVFYVIPQKNLATPSIVYGKYYALIIGVNNYKNSSLRSLDKPISDAKSIYDVLTTKYNFAGENVTLLADPTRNDIIEALDNLQAKIKPNDCFLLFYAGHGTYDKDAKIGFWLPSDASRESRANWISNSNLTDYLKLIKAKHTLVISDACFSGSIFVSRGAFDEVPDNIEKAYSLPSREALTSGSLYEVPDNSIFIFYLLDRLNKNEERYLTAEQLYINIKTAVKNNSSDNTQFGDIQGVGHEGGDFVFVIKQQ
jgi:Caspase domain